jgi:hypothetical protein
LVDRGVQQTVINRRNARRHLGHSQSLFRSNEQNKSEGVEFEN